MSKRKKHSGNLKKQTKAKQEENSMAFEDYKDLDLKPEKATQEEIEQLRKKYGVSEFHDTSLRAREFLRRQEEKNS